MANQALIYPSNTARRITENKCPVALRFCLVCSGVWRCFVGGTSVSCWLSARDWTARVLWRPCASPLPGHCAFGVPFLHFPQRKERTGIPGSVHSSHVRCIEEKLNPVPEMLWICLWWSVVLFMILLWAIWLFANVCMWVSWKMADWMKIMLYICT